MGKMEINLMKNDIRTAIKIMMAGSKIDSMAELARELGIKEVTFRKAVNTNSLRLVDFIRVAEVLKYDVVTVRKDQEEG